MATITHESPYHERRLVERRRLSQTLVLRGADGLRVSWGGIWGGVLCAVGLLAWRLTLVGMMVRQYPWLYERSGALSWRTKSSA